MVPDPANVPTPAPRESIPPDLLEWARQTFDEDAFVAQMREIEATGGLQLEDFLAELAARARGK